MSDTIICPQCSFEIEVAQTLSAQLRTQLQKEFEAQIGKKETALAEREKEIARAKVEVEKAEQAIDDRVAAQLEEEKKKLSDEALAKAREQVTVELRDKEQQLSDAQAKLKDAQEAELALRKERRELEEQKESLELTLTRRLDEERASIREAAKKEAAEERELKDADKDKMISDLQKQIGELKRKSEQASQQLQGEVMEISLEDLLRRTFPYDDIEEVPKGIHGGDVLQHVRDGGGHLCGTILWESKRTKNWSDGWLPKLRDDQRAAKAQFAVLTTIEMPKDLSHFGCIDGVWVTNRACITGLASALRIGLIEAAKAKSALDGRHDKMELVYTYLSGPEFRHRVEGIVESFVTLRNDLEAEKRAMNRIWAKREKQLDRAVSQTTGMYGDLSGIIGRTLPAIQHFELALESAETDFETEA